MNKEQLKGLAPSFQKMLGLSVATELYGTKHKTPKFICNIGQDCYTDNRSIVVGFNHPTFDWCETKADYYENADYIKGHEVQHIKSTTNKAWQFAIKRGCETVIERLCKDQGIGVRLSTERDYDLAIRKLREEKKIYISINLLQTICHFIANSLEDGRIEAIRASENEVFKKQMVHIRLLDWANQPIANTTDVDKMDANEKLTIIMNQILSLSTSSVYQKGFASRYYDTELRERVEDVIPNIAKGITAKRCRDMATEAIAICEKLSDLIAEAAKIPAFEEQTIKWIKASIKDFDLGERNTSETEEDENTAGENPFGNSDLYLILPDDEYDELMDKMKDAEKPDEEQGKIHIRREHPKEEESDSEDEGDTPTSNETDNSTPGENSSGKQETAQNTESEPTEGSTGNVSDDTADADESYSQSSSSDLQDSTSESQESANGDGMTDQSNSFDDGCDGQSHEQEAGGDETESKSDDINSQGQKRESGKSGEQASSNAGSSGNSSEEDILKAMEEAAEAAAGMAESEVDTCEKILNKQEKAQDMSQDVEEPVSKTDQAIVDAVKQNYEGRDRVDLIEVGRAYKVDTMLPPELMREIETLKKKFETFLHGKKRKHRKQLVEGKLDSSRVAMLAANEINVFKKTKISKDVSACAEIIVDNSGSMGWGNPSKRYNACIALAKIEMLFAEYFPIKMLAFDESGSVIHEIIKNWNEHFSRSAAYNFLEKGRYGSGNFDSYSIRIATADILRRPEKKKLLIILSDGAPCEDPQNVTDAVREARAKGIKVVGIYFDDTYDDEVPDGTFFADMYEKDYIVCRPTEIGDNLLKVCKTFFA